MPRCANGHEVQLALKCATCGAAVSYRGSVPDLLKLPSPEFKFEEAAILFVGFSPLAIPGAYCAEVAVGHDETTARRFLARKVEGGTWLDYNSRYCESFSSWLRAVEFGRSAHRIMVVDTSSPLAVLAVNNVRPAENIILLAVVPGRKGSPTAQNTSYAALQLARRRKMNVVLATDSFVEQLTAFAEGKGLLTAQKAFDQVIAFLVPYISDLADLVQKDAKLGAGAHYFSTLLSGSDKVFKSVDDALSVELTQTSLEGRPEKAITMHLLSAAPQEAKRDFSLAFGRVSSGAEMSLLDAEFRFRDKPSSYGLYDLFLLFGVKEPSVLDELRVGYQTIASTAPDLSLEGRLAQATPAEEASGEEAGQEEAEEERTGPKQLVLMEDFVQARGETVSLLLQLRGDLRGTLLKFSAEIPAGKEPLEGLLGAYKDWLDGVFDEFASSLAEEGLIPQDAEKLCALAFGISAYQNSVFAGDTAAKKKALAFLQELGAGRENVEGTSLTDATAALLRGVDALAKGPAAR